MKMKIIFPKKEMAKEAITNVTSSFVAGGAGVGTAMLLNADMIQKNKEGKATKFGKYAGFAAILLGTGMNCVFAEKHARGAGYGVVAAGSIHAYGNAIMPDHKAKLGLAGVGATDESNNDTYAEMVRKSLKTVEENKAEYKTQSPGESVNGLGEVIDPIMSMV
jgi:hypothetical protein